MTTHDIASSHPLTWEAFHRIPDGPAWLDRLLHLERACAMPGPDRARVVLRDPGPDDADGRFDLIVVGGTLGIIHAAVMAVVHRRRVLVVDRWQAACTHRDWNISMSELSVLVRIGLLTGDELESVINARYRRGFIAFHQEGLTLRVPPLDLPGVLDMAVDANALLALCRRKIENSGTSSEIRDGWAFSSVHTGREAVAVFRRDMHRMVVRAPLLLDFMGAASPIARQLNRGRSHTHVCPTVGTVARGFAEGPGPLEVQHDVGEILVTNEHATNGRQLIWEGFPGGQGRFTSYLFFYDSRTSPVDKSLLNLFEEYFHKLDSYKLRTPDFAIDRMVFGYIQSFHHLLPGNRKRVSADHVLCLGDAAALNSPLTYCGFGSFVRTLHRTTALVDMALTCDCLDADALARINAWEPNVAVTSGFSKFLMHRGRRPTQVNAALVMIIDVLQSLPQTISIELFRDELRFDSYNTLMSAVPRRHRTALGFVLRAMGPAGILQWLDAFIAFARHDARRRRLARQAVDHADDPRGRFLRRVDALVYGSETLRN